jgi:hypothetical protein
MSTLFVASYVLLWILVVGQSIMLFILLRELGRIYLSQSSSFVRDGVAQGSPLPALPIMTPDGSAGLDSLYTGARYTALLVARPDCPYCPEAADVVRQWAGQAPELGAGVVVDGRELGAYADKGVPAGLLDPDMARRQLRVRATPFVFVVDHRGIVLGKGVINAADHLDEVLQRARDVSGAELPSARRDGALTILQVEGSRAGSLTHIGEG